MTKDYKETIEMDAYLTERCMKIDLMNWIKRKLSYEDDDVFCEAFYFHEEVHCLRSCSVFIGVLDTTQMF